MKLKSTAVATAIGLMVMAPHMAQAGTYYVTSGGTGNDSDSGINAYQAWATLDKVNSTAVAGDTVLFKTGDTWSGTLRLKSGVTYATYTPPLVTSAKPIIRGSVNVGSLSWSLDSGNVWVADASSVVVNDTDIHGNTIPGGISQLFFNGQRLTRARYPDAGGGEYTKGSKSYLKSGENTLKVTSYTQNLEVSSSQATLLAGKDLLGADVFVKNNDWFLTRYKSTAASLGAGNILALQSEDKGNNPSHAADRNAPRALDWPGVTDYPIGEGEGGYGYWLEGKRWMISQAGEWSYDPATKRLYVWMKDSSSPAGKALTAAVRLHAIAGRNLASVNISNIEVQETRGDAIVIDGYDTPVTSLSISDVKVVRAGRKGIYVVHTSDTATGNINNTVVEDSINEGIDLSGDRRWIETKAKRINVTNSTVRRAGLGYYARGAILMGHRGDALNNLVENSSYIGILGGKVNTISGNTVKYSCQGFDDCGAIYTGGSYYSASTYEPSTTLSAYEVGSTISNNFVEGILVQGDRLDGSGVSNGYNKGARNTNAVGIYLDDFSSLVSVSGNYVTGNDIGMVVHQGSNNTISSNNVVGNRVQLWMQENLGNHDLMAGNSVTGNVFASASSAPLVYQQSLFGATSAFASFSGNKYASYRSNEFMEDDNVSSLVRFKSFAQWQATGKDSGSSLHATGYGIQLAGTPPQLISYGTFTVGGTTNGWYGHQSTVAVESGSLAVQPAAGADIIGEKRRFGVTPGVAMAIDQGQAYWLSFDAKADAGADLVIGFRRDQLPWDDLSVPLVVPADNSWQSYSRLITADTTLSNSGFGFTLFVDKDVAVAGSKVRFNNVSLRRASLVTGNAGAAGFYNDTSAAKNVNCPNTISALCTNYIDLRTGASVTFPLSVAAKSSRVVVLNNSQWLDPDRDGIPGDGVAGGRDTCASTTDGRNVKESGCTY